MDDKHEAEKFKGELDIYGKGFRSRFAGNGSSDFTWEHHEGYTKKYIHIRICLMRRFLNSIIFWFLNTIKKDDQLDIRSLLTEIKINNYTLENSVLSYYIPKKEIEPASIDLIDKLRAIFPNLADDADDDIPF